MNNEFRKGFPSLFLNQRHFYTIGIFIDIGQYVPVTVTIEHIGEFYDPKGANMYRSDYLDYLLEHNYLGCKAIDSPIVKSKTNAFKNTREWR